MAAIYFHQDSHIKTSVKTCLKFLSFLLLGAYLASMVTGCAAGPKRSGKSYVINGKRYHILASADGYKEKGLASWYGNPFHGRKTASGEVYNMHEISAAHKTLPLHTWVEVKNLKNNKKIILRINDRGPFVDGRIIDLSQAAAKELGVFRPGTAPVVVTALSASKAKQLNRQRQRSTAMNSSGQTSRRQ
jgi:rare lipoprotein A (peptidoglycan hydrolase)